MTNLTIRDIGKCSLAVFLGKTGERICQHHSLSTYAKEILLVDQLMLQKELGVK